MHYCYMKSGTDFKVNHALKIYITTSTGIYTLIIFKKFFFTIFLRAHKVMQVIFNHLFLFVNMYPNYRYFNNEEITL